MPPSLIERGVYSADGLTSENHVIVVVLDLLKVLSKRGAKPPPLPSNPPSLVPCSIVITEWDDPNGVRLGRVRFVHRDGADLFNQIWQMSDPTSAR